MANNALKRIAVFIDAENIPANYARALFAEIAKRGEISFCRAYGDFNAERMKAWVAKLKEFKISAFQQDSVTDYKNAADIALVIGAMDIIHSGNYERFYIVSNDGDFTPLAKRIKTAGYDVIGFGMAQASNPFQSACNDYIFLSPCPMPPPKPAQPQVNKTKVKPKAKMPSNQKTKVSGVARKPIPDGVRKTIIGAVETKCGGKENVTVSEVNAEIKRRMTGFSHKKYNFANISKLLASIPQLRLENGNRNVRLTNKDNP